MIKKRIRLKGMIGAAVAVLSLVLLAACAPQPASEETQDQGEESNTPAISVEWSADTDCGTCHATEQASYDNTACEASLHPDVTCMQCHDDEATLKTVHEGTKAGDEAPKRLKQTEVKDETCLSCHYETRDALVAATDGIATVTDSVGTVRNPHDRAGVAEHESIACADCHEMHSEEAIADTALSQCESCHHAGEFTCYTCHD